MLQISPRFHALVDVFHYNPFVANHPVGTLAIAVPSHLCQWRQNEKFKEWQVAASYVSNQKAENHLVDFIHHPGSRVRRAGGLYTRTNTPSPRRHAKRRPNHAADVYICCSPANPYPWKSNYLAGFYAHFISCSNTNIHRD
jgi:hypothetical protein